MRAPRTFDQLKSRISRRYGTLSGRLRQIAEFALAHPDDMALDTVAAIAERAGVQPSSIIRFANSFGYDGFSEMQKVFRSRLVAHSASYRDRIATLRATRSSGGGAENPRAVLGRFVDDGVAALEHLQQSIRVADLDGAIELMARAETIHVLAQGRAFPVAFYVYYALRRLDRPAQLIDGVGGMARDQARGASPRDLLFAVSFKEYSPEVVSLVADANARGIKSVVITDGALSPIARQASVSFEIGPHGSWPFRSLVSPLCLAQSLVVALGHRLANLDRSAA